MRSPSGSGSFVLDMTPNISDRKKKILAAVVDEYIANAEPVGSKLIAEKAGLHVSSATIRNELAELTALGYLEEALKACPEYYKDFIKYNPELITKDVEVMELIERTRHCERDEGERDNPKALRPKGENPT